MKIDVGRAFGALIVLKTCCTHGIKMRQRKVSCIGYIMYASRLWLIYEDNSYGLAGEKDIKWLKKQGCPVELFLNILDMLGARAN